MALYAFDGTGNDDRADTEEGGFDSNVLHFFRAFQDPGKDFVEGRDTGSLYLKGIGRRAETHTGTVVSQAFGLGGHLRIGIMMDRLAANCAAGDTTVDVIGFSRGAALAVSFANEVARRFPTLSIRFLGVWDIVGEFGLPGQFVNAGHDLRMPRNVLSCYHAMALDERRSVFQLTRLHEGHGPVDKNPTEVWFRGVHSDVGGGNGNFGLNWISLDWMYAVALRQGLPIDPTAVAANRAHSARPQDIKEHKVVLGPRRRILAGDLLHASVETDPGHSGPQRNDPTVVVRRVDNDGNIVDA
jgi:uncharacterized protein (DUF2235 family)